MEMITVTAKTVEDAITQASVQLGVSSDRLQYEVVEKGSAGVLGGAFRLLAGDHPCEKNRNRR